jgi:hypothetical protein
VIDFRNECSARISALTAVQPVTAPDRLPPHTSQQLELFGAANGG